MRAVAEYESKHDTDFYTATLAPVNQPKQRRITGLDAALLVVLILEVFVAIRIFLAS